MSIAAIRTVKIVFSGDITATDSYSTASNAASPGMVDNVRLSSGANTITVPVVTGVTVKSCTIVPPSTNSHLITLKGVSGDTGVPLHLTEPTSIGLDTTATTFVLNAAAQIDGVLLIWA